MLTVLRTTWPLLLGIMLLMVGNGMQGTLLGIRGAIEQIGTYQMSIVMSAYFAGFLLGSQLTPLMIRRVGHVRVFAALGSLISALLILYAAYPNWIAWALMRVLIGFCFSGVYITAESWLNASTANEQRGQALSAYMIVQMVGIISGQALMNVADPAGYLLFVIPSVLVSLAFTPILLSASPAPAFAEVRRLTLRDLYKISPLGVVGIFLMGGTFAALFSMVSVWGTQVGLSVTQISMFVAAIYFGGLVAQYPIGWASDRMDRRQLILQVAVVGAFAMLAAFLLAPGFWTLLALFAVIGGVANPLYALLLAYTNDYLEASDMAAASAGLLFVNGVGAITGPPVTGWLMESLGPEGFFLYVGLLMAGIALYALWRIVRAPDRQGEFTSAYAVVSPGATAFAVEAVLEAGTDSEEPASESTPEGEAAPLDEHAPPKMPQRHP
ncbi:putative MFS family arabinose efflux permease [Rhodobacter aestuarii]|uniref:Predicted arabinose efflux permease, MFS family n=1 Tax=Rhodobacter aestuarii TaxID=453582 RepID=A0A1N7J7D4_9RHOB|nr:MFS transporter [Rhodobacter aestuarii]PTV97104.1 putative MFS family arabinose efflux permease [Rhodobacter aestuarii]SIS45229.1 Predicted arabinose efflux permease, MFS family [Rhodobacter aestuarii]